MSSSWKYVLAYLLIIQLALGYVVPQRWLYAHRMPYEVFKEDPRTLDLALDQIARQIKRERLEDYVIMLGDSVGYSGPGGPQQSIGYFMEEISQAGGRPLTVFNLALPAMQTGDLYVVLLKLRERSIATDRVVINLLYGGFVARIPDPPIAFWLSEELKRLDHTSWERFRDHLGKNDRVKASRSLADLFDEYLRPHIALLAYQPVLKGRLMNALRSTQEVYDTRPWTEKPELPELMKQYMYQKSVAPEPFDMTDANPQIYFLEKILALAEGNQMLIYLTPTNQALMQEYVSRPGYQENLAQIDAWFKTKPVTYLNLEHALPDGLFVDHLHLTPEGYQTLAGMLLEHLGR